MAVESGRAPGGNQHPAGPTSSASTDANDAWAQWQAQAAAAWQRQPASDDSGRPGSSSSTGNDVRSASDRRRVQRLNDLSQPAISTRGPEQENAGPLVQTGGAFSCMPSSSADWPAAPPDIDVLWLRRPAFGHGKVRACAPAVVAGAATHRRVCRGHRKP
jgi:hypothetical protein